MATSGLKTESPRQGAAAPVGPAPSAILPGRDVRRKKPPLLSFLLRMETLRRLGRIASLLAIDFAGVYLAIFTALAIQGWARGEFDAAGASRTVGDLLPFSYLITVLLFARSSLYASRSSRPGLTRIAGSLFQVTVVSLIFALVNGERFSSYYIFYASFLLGIAYVGSLRYGYERVTGVLLRAAGYRRRAVLVGSGHQIEAVAHALKDAGPNPVEVVGFVSLEPRPDNGLRSLGSIDRMADILGSQRLDEVIIADSDFPQERAVELVDICHNRGIKVRVAPSTMEILVHRAELVPGQTVPLFELKPPVFEGVDYALKRGFDVAGAAFLILLTAPVMLACALAVRLTCRGPVIYRSVRPGIGGVPFACLKFRTMHTDAEQLQADLEAHNEASGALFKIREDPRLTRVGRVLRRFSLDELPQLFNVLRGEMSLVGPRPLPLRDFERLEEWHKKRYLVMPGITGLWQVSGRSELDFDELVKLDFLYLERWSVFLDLTILLKTVPAVLARRGAF